MYVLLLTLFISQPEIREIEVDLLETNTVLHTSVLSSRDGTVRFVQIIAWDKGLDANKKPCAIDRGYKVVKDGYPYVHRYGDYFRVVWWLGPDRVYIIKSKSHLITATRHDREQTFRELGGWFKPCW